MFTEWLCALHQKLTGIERVGTVVVIEARLALFVILNHVGQSDAAASG